MPLLPNLRAVRERQALSQADLAELAGMHQPTLSALERGPRNAQPRTLRKLARALKVKPAELLRTASEPTSFGPTHGRAREPQPGA